MKDIKIFVSHRIDLESRTIDNPLYVPVRCGAVYDKREKINMLGDDTGDNISEKRLSFCELTVQYWAWKNVEADYYGLCHYRRYLSFSDNTYDVSSSPKQHVNENYLNNNTIDKHNLNNIQKVYNNIVDNDALTIEPIDIRFVPTPKGYAKDIYTHWKNWRDFLIKEDTLDKLICLVEKKYGEKKKEDFSKYLNQEKYYGFNCFILKKELFQGLCEFEFPILLELEKELDTKYYSETMNRTVGYMGEILTSYYLWSLHCGKYKTKTCQLVYFENTRKTDNNLKPFKDKKNIPVILMSSNYYVPYVASLIESIRINVNDDCFYDIIILEKDITKENKIALQEMSDTKISVRFFSSKEMFSGVNLYIASQFYAEEAYYRVLTPWILKNYDKAIVMDSDLIIKSSLEELFITDIGKNYIAAVKDIVYQGFLNVNHNNDYEYCKSEMGMHNPYNYVNTGVMLMNLKLIREHYTMEEIVDYMGKHKFRIQEQDALNVLFEGNIYFLQLKWNYYVCTNTAIRFYVDHAPYNSKLIYDAEKGLSGIVHYASQPKPWNNPDMPFADLFWECAKKTKFYEKIIHRMILEKNNDCITKSLEEHLHYHYQNDPGFQKTTLDALKKEVKKIVKIFFPYGSHRFDFIKKLYINYLR